jgi:hypothetical protein
VRALLQLLQNIALFKPAGGEWFREGNGYSPGKTVKIFICLISAHAFSEELKMSSAVFISHQKPIAKSHHQKSR